MQDKETLFREYLQTSKIVIVDPSSVSRVSMARMLTEMGVKTSQISLTETIAEGREKIEQVTPNILICEYNISGEYGLDLIQSVRESNKGLKSSLFILVTGNSSQSAVARAAEEDVDCFILKPYTVNRFKSILSSSSIEKLFPSDYIKIIEEGKELLYGGSLDEAKARFESAVPLNKEPTLAYFYLGQVEKFRESLEESKKYFENGISVNKIHFKCLVGLYDLLYSQKKFVDAYNVVRHIAKYFPANPKRLNNVIRLAIVTKNYPDIEAYYETFINLENRNNELVNYICSALLVSARFFIAEGDNPKALDFLKKAAVSSSNQTKFLRFIVEILVEHKMVKEASPFLERFPAEARDQRDYLTMRLLVFNEEEVVGKVIQMGRDLLKKQIQDPMVYKILIQRSIEANLVDSAQTLCFDAKKLWPDRSPEFEGLLPK